MKNKERVRSIAHLAIGCATTAVGAWMANGQWLSAAGGVAGLGCLAILLEIDRMTDDDAMRQKRMNAELFRHGE